jgi:hypothetical protein
MNLLRRYLPNRVPASPSRGGGRSRGPRLPLHPSPHPDRSGEEALLQFRLKRGCRDKWCLCAREWGFYAWKIPHSHNQSHCGGKGLHWSLLAYMQAVLWVTGFVRGLQQKNLENKAVLRIRDPVPYWPLDPGSGMGKRSGSGMKKIRIRDPGPQHWTKDTLTLAQMCPYFKLKRDRNLVTNPVRTYCFGSGSTTLCAGRSSGPSPLWPNSFLILS